MGTILSLAELENTCAKLRNQKKKIVFTNGCFDILHRGHVEYLIKAKSFGDVLIVGINTDASVKRIKGENRPIVEQNDRAFLISNLLPVDFVVLFDEDTPSNLIKKLKPDVLIKGADWALNNIVGKDIVEEYGGIVETIELTPSQSTSGIIRRILERYSKS